MFWLVLVVLLFVRGGARFVAAGNGVARGEGDGIGDTLLELWLSLCKEPVDW